jgi:hypothetical protein
LTPRVRTSPADWPPSALLSSHPDILETVVNVGEVYVRGQLCHLEIDSIMLILTAIVDLNTASCSVGPSTLGGTSLKLRSPAGRVC